VKTAFLTAMERHVEARIRAAAVDIRDGSFDAVAHAHALHGHIRHEAEAAFDAHLPTDTWVRGIERRVKKRWELAQLLRGANRAGAELFAILQIPTPETTKEVMNAA
jgi:hypothetical protein